MATRIFGERRFLIVGNRELLPQPFLLQFRGERRKFISIATNLRSAIAIVRSEKFDCIIVDREMEDGDGLVLAPTIKRIQPKAASLLLSSKTQWATLEAARDLGYHDVLQKSLIEAELMERLELLLKGDGKKESNQNTAGSKIHLLSIREREILNDVATGATTEEIARARHISVATIKSHLTSIYRKLDVRNRVEAVAVLRRG